MDKEKKKDKEASLFWYPVGATVNDFTDCELELIEKYGTHAVFEDKDGSIWI